MTARTAKIVHDIRNKSLDKATTILKENGSSYQIAEIDGKSISANTGFVENRINLVLEKNIVIDVFVG